MGWPGIGGSGMEKQGVVKLVASKMNDQEDSIDEIKLISIVCYGADDAENSICHYIDSGCVGNLVFLNELSPYKQKMICLSEKKYGLKSRTFGEGKVHHLVLYKKRNLSLPYIYQELKITGAELCDYKLPKWSLLIWFYLGTDTVSFDLTCFKGIKT